MDFKLRSFPRLRIIIFLLIFLAILGAGVYAIVTYFVLPGYEIRMDSEGRPCSELPGAFEAERILATHQNEAKQIDAIIGAADSVNLDETRCPGKADVAIYYGTLEQRTKIKELIGDTFYGVPYRLYNV